MVQTDGVPQASPSAELKRRALGEGAAQAAPTAPHATPRLDSRTRSGPERFWARRRIRVALSACLVASGILHASFVPLDVPHGFELNDVEGEATIPIDVMAADEPPHAPSPPSQAASADEGEKEGPHAKVHPAAPLLRPDAGQADAGVDAALGDASTDAPAELEGAVPLARADSGSVGRRDPESIVGADSVRADVVLVKLVVNAEVIRSHPVGARLGYLLRGIPQWEGFMEGTDIDPVRDTDWVMIIGPSLVNTARDTVLIHYSVADTVVDRAVAIVTKRYDRGGPFDAGVRGVKASLVYADRADRVILRPQPHLLAVVPPGVAEKNARVLVAARLSEPAEGDAVYLRLVNPHHPMPEIPESITEMRLRVVPRPDAGADVYVDGDTNDAEAAARAAEGIQRLVRRHNDAITSLLTHGLFDHVSVAADANVVKVHLTATRDQIESIVALVGEVLGVNPGETPTPAPPSPAVSASPSKPWRSR